MVFAILIIHALSICLWCMAQISHLCSCIRRTYVHNIPFFE